VKPPRLGGGECGPCPDFVSNTLRKITENLSQSSRRALGWSAPNAIRLVDLAIAADGLDWPAVPCRPWLSHQATGSALGQLKYLPSCRTRVSPHQLTLSQGSDVVGKQRNAQILVYLPVTYVPGFWISWGLTYTHAVVYMWTQFPMASDLPESNYCPNWGVSVMYYGACVLSLYTHLCLNHHKTTWA